MKTIDLLIETPQDVLNVLQLIKEEAYYYHNENETKTIELLNDRFDLARRDVFKGKGQKIPWEIWFLRTGAIVLSLIEKQTKFEEKVFANFLLVKHFRYGASPLLRWEELGVLIRMDSKLARLINITENKDLGVEDEPPEKTAEDILGYCVLGYLLNRRLKNE